MLLYWLMSCTITSLPILLQLCASLGVTLNRFELETALFVLDKDASGLIDKTEFVSWFRDSGTSLINN